MLNTSKILIVEDDEDINKLLCTFLRKNAYEVFSAYSGSEAKMCIDTNKYDLVILDLMLPGITGENLIKEIRKTKNMPVIISSAKSDLDDKINLLKLGADDYITKPFELGEVLARVEAQLRRYNVFSKNEPLQNSLSYKNAVLEKDSMKLLISENDVMLTVKEFEILQLLLSYPNKVFTRENLYKQIWNDEYYGEDNTVNVHISNIRNKIAKYDKNNEYIKTIWGIGFKMAD